MGEVNRNADQARCVFVSTAGGQKSLYIGVGKTAKFELVVVWEVAYGDLF